MRWSRQGRRNNILFSFVMIVAGEEGESSKCDIQLKHCHRKRDGLRYPKPHINRDQKKDQNSKPNGKNTIRLVGLRGGRSSEIEINLKIEKCTENSEYSPFSFSSPTLQTNKTFNWKDRERVSSII